MAVRAQRGRCIEVGTFGQYPAFKGAEVDADQSMLINILFDGQHQPGSKLQAAVAACALGQRLWGGAVQRLQVQLLIGFVDEHHGLIAQAKRATAVLVHPAACAETAGRQAVCQAIAPVPDAGGGVLWAIFIPEQALWADSQLCEVDPGGNGECGAEWFSF